MEPPVEEMAANEEPERFARLVLVGPSPRYINDPPDYVGGFERADIEGLLETMEKNYIGWANFLAPAIMKNPDRPELSQELEVGVKCKTKRGWASSHRWIAGVLWVELLSSTRWTFRSAGTSRSSVCRNFLNSIARWRACSRLMTLPVVRSSAA